MFTQLDNAAATIVATLHVAAAKQRCKLAELRLLFVSMVGHYSSLMWGRVRRMTFFIIFDRCGCHNWMARET